MLPQSALIPNKATSIPSGSFLVFAPHPDDEVFSMGGTLFQASQLGQTITIVYMTNGELGGNPDIRVAEAKNVCKSLNANPIFLKIPDRGIKATQSLFEKVKKIILDIKPDNIFFPSPEEYHIDHRATSITVWQGLHLAKFTGSSYYYEVSRQCDCDTLIDITSSINDKELLCNIYLSQLTENNYIEVVRGINKARTYTLPATIKFAEALLKINSNYKNQRGYYKYRNEKIFIDTLPSDRPIISFLVRTKNRPKLLKRCLTSLVNQNYNDYIDVVVVNDGGRSVDDICASYRNQFYRLKQINLPDSIGRAGAANTALINATGEFCNFLDDDDQVDSNHTEVFLNHWRRNNDIEILYRGVRVLDDNGDLVKFYNEPYDAGRIMASNYIPIHSVTFSKRFIKMGCRFDERLKYMEDWDFWIQLSRLSKFFHVPIVTSSYNLVGSSAASAHMSKVYDNQNHTHAVTEKWLPKWSAVELLRMKQYLSSTNAQQFEEKVDSIMQSLARTVLTDDERK